MKNCLVEKYVDEVNNDNLDYFDKVHMTFTLKNSFPSENTSLIALRDKNNAALSNNVLVKNENTDGAVVSYSGGYLKAIKGSTNTIKVLLKKYVVERIGTMGNVTINMSDILKFYNLNTFYEEDWNSHLTNASLNDLKELINLKKVRIWVCNETASLSLFAEMPQLTLIDLKALNHLSGDLSVLKDMPNLTSLSIVNVPGVTDNDNTVAYLQNKGVTVTFNP